MQPILAAMPAKMDNLRAMLARDHQAALPNLTETGGHRGGLRLALCVRWRASLHQSPIDSYWRDWLPEKGP
jgi:hypothetical protein